jgi:hypothetical protein
MEVNLKFVSFEDLQEKADGGEAVTCIMPRSELCRIESPQRSLSVRLAAFLAPRMLD